MRSVADSLRKATLESAGHLTPEERVELAFRLGDDDLATYAQARGLSAAAAWHELTQRRRAGRRPSRAVDHPAP